METRYHNNSMGEMFELPFLFENAMVGTAHLHLWCSETDLQQSTTRVIDVMTLG